MSVQEVLPCVLTTARILQDPTPAVVAQAMLSVWMGTLVQVRIIILLIVREIREKVEGKCRA